MSTNNKEFKNLLEDLDSGEEVKTKYGVCYAYSPDVVEELKQAITELKQIKEAKPSVAIGELETLKELVDEFVKLPKNKIITRAFDDIKQALLKTQEQGNVLNWIIKHLSFEDGGVGVVNDFITGKRETKYFIKVKSKDTGATIHIHLDTKEESEILKRWQNEKRT